MKPIPSTNAYSADPIVNAGPLPDVFAKDNGERIARREQWPERVDAWRRRVVETEYGGLPPAPEAVRCETLCHSSVRRFAGEPSNWSYRIHCEGGERPFSFCARLMFPKSPSPVPVILNGDGCWWYLSDEVLQRALEAGFGVAIFNRTELAEDLGYSGAPDQLRRSGGLYDVYPGRTFGALAAWAWGYHRAVDWLRTLPFVDGDRIAVTGHSRGGKTTLLAGATDPRIAVVNDNASGAGGGAAFRYVGHGGETLNIVNVFPSWFGPQLRDYVGREADLPFDQHALLAAIAPRPLLQTYALDDRWSNPEGLVQSHWAAKEVYRFLGAEDRLAFHLRPGTHAHAKEDWVLLVQFLQWQWRAAPAPAALNVHPYAHLRPAFDWKAPAVGSASHP